jgi:DNA polymerase I-like protein with 3'-5' exonuclease and polymerase domains
LKRLHTPVVLTPDHLAAEVDYFMEQDAFVFDVEAWGPNRGVPTRNTVNWMSMATHGRTIVVPFGHPNGSTLISRATKKKNKETGKFDPIPAVYDEPPEQMLPSEVFSLLRPLFFSTEIEKWAHNATFDLISVVKYFGGEIPPPPYGDTIVLQWLLDENLQQKGLKDLTDRYYGVRYDHEQVGKCVEAHPFDTVAHYAYMDSKYTWLIRNRLLPYIEKQNLQRVWDLEMDVLGVLVSMGITGAAVDVEAIEELREDLSKRVVEIESDIYKAAGKVFNINSNPQKQQILYGPKAEGGQGLKPKKETKGGAPSTDAATLERYPSNPVAKTLLAYQEVNKLLGTYVLGYLGDPDDPKKPCRIFDGKIHADFVQYGTVTGRFSCREPNLQNIPRPGTELGTKIRGLFIAPPGHKLVVADYSQVEMVLLAHFIGYGRLYEGLHAGLDPHTATAAGVFKVKPEDVTKEQRQAAKGINFAVVYGAGPDKVAAMAGVGVNEAKKFLKQHQEMFPEIYKFKDAVIKRCKGRKPPHITTLFGRRRRLPQIFAKDFSVSGYAERQAVNSLIQGSAADLIKFAMVRLHRSLPDDIKLSLSVHDELVVVCPDGRTDIAVDLVREAMLGEGIASLIKTPLTSDVKVVERWSEAK